MREIIYGTENAGKIAYMERALEGTLIKVTAAKKAADKRGLVLPAIEENGDTPLENARLKAESYFRLFKSPVFSCDSGLYLWDHAADMPLPEKEQPGIHVRGRGSHRLTDEELLEHYISMVKKYGPIRARYKNAICLIWNEAIREESMEEDLWGEAFLLTDIPHGKRMPGFPLDSISLDMKTGKYFYDMEENLQDNIVSDNGFIKKFFCSFLEKNNIIC